MDIVTRAGHATTWPYIQPKFVDYCIMSTIRCDYVLHLDIEALTFLVFFLVTEALLPCRVVVVAKIKNCRVPSSECDMSCFRRAMHYKCYLNTMVRKGKGNIE